MKDREFMARALGVVLIFAGAGPLIGGFVFGLLWIVEVLTSPSEPWRAAYLTTPIYAALLGYLAGFLPAVTTGVGAALTSPRLRAGRLWVAVAVLLGATTSAVNLVFLNTGYPTSRPDGADVAGIMLIGAISSLACALLAEPLRPRPRPRRNGAG
jgi:hypothetical protein